MEPEEWLGMAERQQDPCSLSAFFPGTEGREQTFAERYRSVCGGGAGLNELTL